MLLVMANLPSGSQHVRRGRDQRHKLAEFGAELIDLRAFDLKEPIRLNLLGETAPEVC